MLVVVSTMRRSTKEEVSSHDLLSDESGEPLLTVT